MVEAFGLSDKGRVRSNNEDYFIVAPDLDLFLVADGMGGAACGEKASSLAAQTVAEFVRQAGRRDSQVLLMAVEEANRRVREAAKADSKLNGMGTTLVAALDLGGELSIASVGDSRAYLLEEDCFRAVTDDQSWVNDVGRPLGLDETALRNHPMRHVLTMAIGADSSLLVNYYSVPFPAGAQLLLSSDGLHGVLEPDDIEKILRSSSDSLEQKCHRLIEASLRAGGPDNITAVLIRAV